MDPRTRIENYLGLIAGDEDAQEIAPKTRMEYYLNEIAKKTNDGGHSVFIVTVTMKNSGGQTTYTSDKSFAQISAAVAAGFPVIVKLVYWTNNVRWLYDINIASTSYVVEATGIYDNGDNENAAFIRICFYSPQMSPPAPVSVQSKLIAYVSEQ